MCEHLLKENTRLNAIMVTATCVHARDNTCGCASERGVGQHTACVHALELEPLRANTDRRRSIRLCLVQDGVRARGRMRDACE
eukprot:1283670-Pleurochrysis_carterae.AAC.2